MSCFQETSFLIADALFLKKFHELVAICFDLIFEKKKKNQKLGRHMLHEVSSTSATKYGKFIINGRGT